MVAFEFPGIRSSLSEAGLIRRRQLADDFSERVLLLPAILQRCQIAAKVPKRLVSIVSQNLHADVLFSDPQHLSTAHGDSPTRIAEHMSLLEDCGKLLGNLPACKTSSGGKQ